MDLGEVWLWHSPWQVQGVAPTALASASTVPSSSRALSRGIRVGGTPRPEMKKGQKQSTEQFVEAD